MGSENKYHVLVRVVLYNFCQPLTLTPIIFILQPSVDSLAQSGANGDSELLFDVS